MRKFAMLLCLMVLLTGCTGSEQGLRFAYQQKEPRYGSADGVIGWENRQAPGHEEDLQYLLTLYLEGPLDDTLFSPFPAGTALEGFTYSDSTLYVTLTEQYAGLDGIAHTVASACIAQTCFQLTPAEKVVIKCTSEQFGNKSITLYRDSVLLYDDSTAPPQTEVPQ